MQGIDCCTLPETAGPLLLPIHQDACVWRARRSLLTQEGICLQLQPGFHFLEVAYPYIARRLLTDEDPALRERLFQACAAFVIDHSSGWSSRLSCMASATRQQCGNCSCTAVCAEAVSSVQSLLGMRRTSGG